MVIISRSTHYFFQLNQNMTVCLTLNTSNCYLIQNTTINAMYKSRKFQNNWKYRFGSFVELINHSYETYLETVHGFGTIAVYVYGSIVHFAESLNFQVVALHSQIPFPGYIFMDIFSQILWEVFAILLLK